MIISVVEKENESVLRSGVCQLVMSKAAKTSVAFDAKTNSFTLETPKTRLHNDLRMIIFEFTFLTLS